jgi:hypothetical protein
MFDANTLLASLVWGSVGMGLIIYAKKQTSLVHLVGGIVMLAISYLASTALTMSVLSIGLITVMYWLRRRGF